MAANSCQRELEQKRRLLANEAERVAEARKRREEWNAEQAVAEAYEPPEVKQNRDLRERAAALLTKDAKRRRAVAEL